MFACVECGTEKSVDQFYSERSKLGHKRKCKECCLAPLRVNRAGSVYWIRCLDRVKIGFTSDIERRLYQLRSENAYELELLAVIPGTMADEAALHARFDHHRIHNEWFSAAAWREFSESSGPL